MGKEWLKSQGFADARKLPFDTPLAIPTEVPKPFLLGSILIPTTS
jgi:hypothetical protein